MTSKPSKVGDLLKQKILFFDGGFLSSTSLSKEDFDEIFPLNEFPSQRYETSNNESSVDCDEINYIFEDWYDFIAYIDTQDYVHEQNLTFPKEIILKDIGFRKIGEFALYFKQWILLFDELASHQYLNENKTYVFIEKKSVNTSTVLEIKVDEFSKSQVESLIKNISSPSTILDSCLHKDAHQGERRATMKTSLTNIINDKKLNLFELFCSSEELLETFHRNYETYLRSFSFEEFIKDLEDDVGSFINKVEEQIQGFYVQALAVPGAVILSSAFRGADKGISISLIFSSILAVTIVLVSLKSKIKFINRITDNTLTKLKIYQKRTDDIENSAAKEAILDKVDNAIKSVEETSNDTKIDIVKMRDIIIVVGMMYLIATVILGRL
jgi:hypothetical protein